MIFVTVGTQLPFDRMVRLIDRWAGQRHADVFAQIGPTAWRPQHIQWAEFLSAPECQQKMQAASVVVAHAGMGSIITALELGKPILVMPRRADMGEHRNEHQLATAERFLAQGRIAVAFDERELLAKLDELDSVQPAQRISPHASPQLLDAIRRFIAGQDVVPELRQGMAGEAVRIQPNTVQPSPQS